MEKNWYDIYKRTPTKKEDPGMDHLAIRKRRILILFGTEQEVKDQVVQEGYQLEDITLVPRKNEPHAKRTDAHNG